MTASHDRQSTVFIGYVAAAAIALSATIATTSGKTQTAPTPQQEEEFARVAHELTEKVCSECHPIDDVIAARRTARDWNSMVITMATRGANATDEQFATIKRYLTRYYGLVAVNTATAEELSAVLGLTQSEAAAVVGYRKAHGKFANVEALLKVPGLDKAKVEAQPDALQFD